MKKEKLGTYPAKIEVMQTAEPTAIPASSPTCTNSDDAQPQKKMEKIYIYIYIASNMSVDGM